jgi:hypothetical protein
MGGRATDVLPGRPQLWRFGLVGEFGVVHLQRPAHGVALLELRGVALRASIFQLCKFESHRGHQVLDT